MKTYYGKNRQCIICKKSIKFKNIAEIKFENVIEPKNVLTTPYYFIKCISCNHIFCEGDYSRKVLKLMYERNHDVTIKNRGKIYSSIVKFNLSHLLEKSSLKVLDLGGSDGSFLEFLSKEKKIKNIADKTVIDLVDNLSKHSGIKFLKTDLNNAQLPCNFNYIFCIHVLEHLKNPRKFLEKIYKISNNFYMYIEVPSTELLEIHNTVKLVTPYHVHYFTLKNLIRLSLEIGFDIIKAEITETDGVPRIKLLVEKKNNCESFLKYLREEEKRDDFIKRNIIKKTKKKIGLWGIGHEFRRIMEKYPVLKNHLNSNNVMLIDVKFKGKFYNGKKIYYLNDLKKFVDEIIILPMLEDTRASIRNQAKKLGFKRNQIFDPYSTYIH